MVIQTIDLRRITLILIVSIALIAGAFVLRSCSDEADWEQRAPIVFGVMK